MQGDRALNASQDGGVGWDAMIDVETQNQKVEEKKIRNIRV